jgi:hypothetical protein
MTIVDNFALRLRSFIGGWKKCAEKDLENEETLL